LVVSDEHPVASGPACPGSGQDGLPARPAGERRTPVVVRVARVVTGGAVTGLCLVLVWWWAIGGTWLIVSTPSMGTDAPVGTLLWVAPTDIGDIGIGDVITFRRPLVGPGVSKEAIAAEAASPRTYTHRVIARNHDGTLRTKGDINAGKDPWHVDQRDLVGRVEARWQGIGWLVKALPLLLLGGIAMWVATALFASTRARAPLRVLGIAGLVAVAIYVHNPLFGATKLSFVPIGEAGARATYVGTGLLPMRLEAEGVEPVLVHNGHKESIVVPHEDDDGEFRVTVVPTIPWVAWVVVAAGCLAPAVWSMIAGVEGASARRARVVSARQPVHHAAGEHEGQPGEGRQEAVAAGDR
jgi:hypothetical protein